MKLSIRMRVSAVAGVVLSAGLMGCQTCRDCVDRLPRPGLPSLRTITPFRKSTPPTYAEPIRQPPHQVKPTQPDLPILPEPAATNVPSRSNPRPVSRPPALPPFDPETPVPSAGLFPPGPVRKIGFETSSIIKDSNIVQTGFCSPVVSSCCPPSCCPTACCVTSCCPSSCGMTSRILGAVTRPYYSVKYGIQNAKDRMRCKLSAFGSRCRSCCAPCSSPCALSCNPCGSSCVISEHVMTGSVVGQYPMTGGCSSCATGFGSASLPGHTHIAPQQQLWRQPVHNFRRPACACQSQQFPPYQQPVPQVHPQLHQPQPQYHGVRPVHPAPQAAVQQRPAQQPVARSNQPRANVASSKPVYTAPKPVQPVQQHAANAPAEEANQQSKLTPGHTPLTSQSSRTAKIFRATRSQ